MTGRVALAAGVVVVQAILACEGAPSDVLPVDRTGGTSASGGAGGAGSGGGAQATGGVIGAGGGSGGGCEPRDPEDRCSIPEEICASGFCEPICVDTFYCKDGGVMWRNCTGVLLYQCPHGCEEEEFNGSPVITHTESEVCTPGPASGGGTNLGGNGG